jgi:DNA-binding CsgD family transcriptional regulator
MQTIPAPETPALAAIADTLAYPLMALQVDGHLLYANHAARMQLDAGAPLEQDSVGRVQPRTTSRRAGFSAALRNAAQGERQALLWLDQVAVLRAWVCPLAGAQPGEPMAPVMLVQTPPKGLLLDVSGFAMTHQLTPAETRVLQQLVAGCSTQAAASALEVSVATVRTHVMGIRRKTGHRDVPALLVTLGALPPLLPPM